MGEITPYTLHFGFMLYSEQGRKEGSLKGDKYCPPLSKTPSAAWIKGKCIYGEVCFFFFFLPVSNSLTLI